MKIEVDRSSHFGKIYIVRCNEDELIELRVALGVSDKEGLEKNFDINQDLRNTIDKQLESGY